MQTADHFITYEPQLPHPNSTLPSDNKQISKKGNNFTITPSTTKVYFLLMTFTSILHLQHPSTPPVQTKRKQLHYPLLSPIVPTEVTPPQDTPPPPMEPTELEHSLAEIFNNQMSVTQNQEILDLEENEEGAQEEIPLTLLIKPFGFKPPPPKAIIPRFLQARNIRRGVTIVPKKYSDEILVCLFRDKRDLLYVEKERAWSVQGAHMMIARWDNRLSLEEIVFDTVTFWIQIRGIPPEMLSTKNIAKLAEKAWKVIEIDWKDTPSLSKWYVTPRALVRVPVATPLCPGNLINRKNGTPTWVYFKYEHLKTFCYDCGILGHEQSHCASETPAPPNLYGP
ncbi:hypothetical protein CRG98_045308 [Punica granatum]|uniref:CCHC-type domain-containing protein n=1 Tax=Punica granatum TaxID=22663 RepID=A0A2I0HS61_PUNGR|nr:hypothetical protein CRG98_045308 [Punica granatum]